MKLTSRDKRAVVLGLAGLVLLGLVRWTVIPWAGDWADARGRIPASRARLGDLQTKMAKVIQQREELEETYGPSAGKALDNVENTRISLLNAVQGVVRSGGFQNPSYQPQPARAIPEVPGVQLVPLQVTGKCQLPQLAKCLADIRKSDTLIVVDRVVANGNEKQPGQLEVTLLLATLARQEK